MAPFWKLITAPPSPCLQVMTPLGSPPQESCLLNTDKDDLKQLFVDAIRQVLWEMPAVPASSNETPQPTTASLLKDLLDVFQATWPSAATTKDSTSASVGLKKIIHLQVPCDSQGVTPPNSPCITLLETVAKGQLKESTGLLVPSTDDPSAYSIYAEEPQDTVGDCKVSGNPKISVTNNNFDVARPFGTSTPQFNANELESLLANAAKTRNWADSPDTVDGLDLCQARETESEHLRGGCQGIPYPGDSHAVLDYKPQTASDGAGNSPAGPEIKAENNPDSDDKRTLASRMEYKTINKVYVQHCPYSTSANYKHSWDSKAYEYKIIDSPPPQDVSELDEFVFIVRKHIQKQMHDAIIYMDIKSPVLRNILRCVLKDVRTAGLEADKPAPHTNMFGQILDHEIVDRVQSNGMDPSELKEEELAICSLIVLSFSLNEKIWGEFAVEKVATIQFSNTPFDMLALPKDKKKVIKSLTESWVRATTEGKFDDIIEGKGQGVIILLHAQAEQLEVQLTRTFHVASNWKAVLLLDEADVYLQRRDGLQLERNRLVATFLRTLKYYPGAEILEDEIRNFAEVSLNGRQIKNVIKLAHNVAMSEGVPLRADHIRSALRANGYTIPTPGSKVDNSLYDY
ncbi:hypothetical protein CNMCM8980_000784 [Aspergillus fumigatiaffinis]|nr:hypothetical protein CNMCM5878_000826 [Aspergillus fumigatiaffinis]KAF4250416.1 hypothetical protein CNMCM8980_000784 [Aspergillus fumigatiaffinis]